MKYSDVHIKALIVEDEMIIATDLKQILESNGIEVTAIAKTYDEAVNALDHVDADIILLDIQLKGKGKNGIELAKLINDKYAKPFIFVSSYTDDATIREAKAVNPLGYVIKPFEEVDVLISMEIALTNYSKRVETQTLENKAFHDSIFLRQNKGYLKVKLSDIICVKADSNYSELITKQKKYVVRMTLKDVFEKLPEKSFFRTHKSYIVNLTEITQIEIDSIHLNEIEVPISRSQHQLLMDYINKL